MTRPLPTKAFAGVTLDLATIPVGQRFGRIYPARYPDPLGVGKTRSRFSDPRRRVASDVVRGSDQSLARSWSVAFHTHPSCPDGVIYPSRLNGEVNLALYDRAVGKVAAASTGSLFAAPGLASVLNVLKVALV